MSALSRASRGGHNASRGNIGGGAMSRANRGMHGHGPKGKVAAGSAGDGGVQNAKAESLVQRARSGSGLRRSAGRRRSNSRGGSSSLRASTNPTQPTSKPATYKDYSDQMLEKYNLLKTRREQERAQAIRQGFLADPEKKTTLKDAITPVGTCTDMCAEFERVQRIVQNAVDRTEKVMDEDLGREIASEERMVKRFRRSAAGDDEQLPSDIRTPATLKRSLDYLINDVVGGGEMLATVHKFVWDRTRCIRNDFSIQQVTKAEDVKLAVECFERIARFHILSLHQLSNPDNLAGGNFDAHQEREQLNNTLLSLMYYYDDHRSRHDFKNEAEFRAYCIILEMQATHPDLEHRMQTWPKELLQSVPVKNACFLHSAASNTLLDQGPLKPTTPFLVAQSNYEGFWKRMRSHEVSYLMACLAESHFNQIRYMALQNIWTSNKRAPAAQQKQNDQWNVDELTKALAFDTYHQTLAFCQSFGLSFRESGPEEVEFLDFTSFNSDKLSPPAGMNRQVFSEDVVERKRFWRTFPAVINGKSIAEAIKEGLIEEASEADESMDETAHDEDGIFVSEIPASATTSTSLPQFNPTAPVFKPAESAVSVGFQPPKTSVFGQPTSQISFGGGQSASTPFPASKTSIFGQPISQTSTGSQEKDAKAPFQQSTIFGQAASTPSFGSQDKPFCAPKTLSTTFGEGSFNSFKPKAPEPTSSPFSTPFKSFGTAPQNVPSIFGQPSTPSTSTNTVSNSSTTPAPAPGIFSQPSLVPPSTSSSPFQFGLPSVKPSTTKSSEPSPFESSAPASEPETQPLEKGPQLTPSFSFLRPTSTSPRDTPSPPTTSSLTPSGFETPSRSQTPPATTLEPDKTQSSQPSPEFGRPPSASVLDQAQPSQPPSFSFSQPTVTGVNGASDKSKNESSRLATSDSAPAFTPSTTSKIPPLFTPPPNTASRFPRDTRPKTSSPLSQQPDIAPQSPVKTQTLSSSLREPHKGVDKTRIIERVAELAMTEKQGLLQQFVEHRTFKIVQQAMQQFEQEQQENLFYAARVSYLSRKFGLRWRDIAYKKALNRRAKARRSLIAETVRQKNLKRQRQDDQLQAILEAQKEKEEIQRAQQLENLEHAASLSPPPATVLQRTQPVASVAGKKRKSLQTDEPERPPAEKERVFAKSHKRSRTMDNSYTMKRPAQATASSPPGPTSSNSLLSSTLSGRSILLNYPDSPEIQSAARRMKVDRTNTDYFRLKAIGIDPETTVVPHTKESLEQKQKQKELERKQSSLTWSQRRRRAMSTAEKVNPLLAKALKSKASSPSASTSARSVSAPRPGNASLPQPIEPPAAPAQPAVADEDDEFLRQIREVRNALTQDTQWFKDQTEQIEEEHRRRSSSGSYQSPPSRSSLSPNGASLVNGYEFAPSGSGVFTRSEQRLRQSGGHGLATRPVADYLPGGSRYIPAMSKRSAEALRRASLTGHEDREEAGGKSASKGKRKLVDPPYQYESDQNEDDIREVLSHQKKKGKAVHEVVQEIHVDHEADEHLNGNTDPDNHYRAGNHESLRDQYLNVQFFGNGDENEEFDEDEDQDDEDEDAIDSGNRGTSYQGENEDADEEGFDDEEEDEEEGEGEGEEEDEDEDEDEGEQPGELPDVRGSEHGYGRLKRVLRSATPEETDFTSSRSRSGSQKIGVAGTGASQDDALVLSD